MDARSWLQQTRGVALALVLLSAGAFGDIGYPTAGPQFGVEDYNTSTVFQLSDCQFGHVGLRAAGEARAAMDPGSAKRGDREDRTRGSWSRDLSSAGWHSRCGGTGVELKS